MFAAKYPSLVSNIGEALQILEEYERETTSKFVVLTSPKNFGSSVIDLKGKKIYWNTSTVNSNHNSNPTSIDGKEGYTPFIIVERKVYNCHHGIDKSLSTKKKAKANADAKELENHTTRKSRKRHFLVKPTKKLGCPANIVLREIVIFPEFKITTETQYSKNTSSRKLKEHWAIGMVRNWKRLIHIQFSNANEHTGHHLGEGSREGHRKDSKMEDLEKKRMKMDGLEKNRTACHGKIFCLITGASKGFGRAVAKSFSKLCNFEQGSVMVLSGRDEAGLSETKANVEEINNKINVHTEVWDLENVEEMENFTTIVFNFDGSQFDRAILINNAGSLGDVTKKLVDPMPVDYYRKHFDINVSSVFLLIQQFFKAFKSSEKLVVNVSSLAAIQEMQYMSLYCTVKAARDMMHKVLAYEEENVRVLNYAPGPMETEMSMEIELNCGNEVSRTFFKELRESKKIIDPDESADKMIRIIKEDQYKSGEHIDFYDNV